MLQLKNVTLSIKISSRQLRYPDRLWCRLLSSPLRLVDFFCSTCCILLDETFVHSLFSTFQYILGWKSFPVKKFSGCSKLLLRLVKLIRTTLISFVLKTLLYLTMSSRISSLWEPNSSTRKFLVLSQNFPVSRVFFPFLKVFLDFGKKCSPFLKNFHLQIWQ